MPIVMPTVLLVMFRVLPVLLVQVVFYFTITLASLLVPTLHTLIMESVMKLALIA